MRGGKQGAVCDSETRCLCLCLCLCLYVCQTNLHMRVGRWAPPNEQLYTLCSACSRGGSAGRSATLDPSTRKSVAIVRQRVGCAALVCGQDDTLCPCSTRSRVVWQQEHFHRGLTQNRAAHCASASSATLPEDSKPWSKHKGRRPEIS